MADDWAKLSHALLDNQAAQNRARDAIQLTGKSLPCVVEAFLPPGAVTVSFQIINLPFTLPQVTVPVAWSEYTRLPIQPGCKGVVRPADAQLGGVSGLGSGIPSLSQPSNLGALVFEPVGNTAWMTVPANTFVCYGEPNALIMDKTGTSNGLFTSTGITLSFGGTVSIVMASSGITLSAGGFGILINDTGTTIDGVPFLPHEHIDGGGTGNSGPVA